MMARFKAERVLALAERNAAFTLFHIFSMGLRSGEYGGICPALTADLLRNYFSTSLASLAFSCVSICV